MHQLFKCDLHFHVLLTLPHFVEDKNKFHCKRYVSGLCVNKVSLNVKDFSQCKGKRVMKNNIQIYLSEDKQ